VGVILGYPGERADPFGQEEASAIEVSVVAEGVTKLPTSSSEQASPRQPPTVSDTTAAASLRSTIYLNQTTRVHRMIEHTNMQESKRKITGRKAHTRTHSTLIHTHISKLLQ